MSGEVRLGLRLARGRERGEQARGGATTGAHLIGVWLMLIVFAAVRAEIALPSYDGDGVPFLALTVVATVGVPIMVLLATVARLSAALRDRRLVSLRVLGLSPSRTRIVSAVEAGAGAAVGSLLGLGAFWLTRPIIRGLDVSGRDWSSGTFAPWPAATVLVVVGLPLLAILVALVPGARQFSGASRPAALAPNDAPSLWRLLLLPIGLVTTWVSTLGYGGNLGYGRFSVLVAGGVLSAIGLILVIPVFTRLIADIVLRASGRPSLRIAGRRLQAQPAAVSRIVAGLLVALFVVSGARMVLGAFEDSAQYRAADSAAHGGPARYDVVSQDADPTRLARELASVDGVRAAYPAWQLMTGCTGEGPCLTAFVGTCDDLLVAVPDARGCRDDRPSWLDGPEPAQQLDPRLTWTGQNDPPGTTATVDTPARTDVIISGSAEYAVGDAMQARVFLPITTPGIASVVESSSRDMLVPVSVHVDSRIIGESGLRDAALGIDATSDVYDPWEDGSYEFITGLRALTWTVAAVVLAVGLVGFAVATIDRAVSRRAEMVSLQLVGTGRGVIRAAQWWEAAAPLVIGVFLAIAAGSAVGYGYLSLADATASVPWQSIGTLAAISAAAAIGVAGLTVIACAPRIRAELIRRA